MTNARVYRENVRFDIAHPEAFADLSDPQASELNNSDLVFNVTCALDEDGTEYTLGDPDTDESLSFCDAAGAQTATFKNPTVTLQSFRDEDRDADGLYNLTQDLLAFPDAPFVIINRVGYDSDVAYAAGQRINLVSGKTDLPVSVEDSGTNARLSNTILPDGIVNWGHVVTA